MKALEEGIALRREHGARSRPCPTSTATSRRWRSSGSTAPNGSTSASSCRRARVLRRRRHGAQHHLREGAPGHLRARRVSSSSSRASRAVEAGGRQLRARAATPNGFFTCYDDGGRFVSYYGDNHPHYAGNVVKAMASAKHGYPHVVALFADELARARPGRTAGARARVAARSSRARRRAARRASSASMRLTPTIVEVIVQGARRGAPLPARPVLPAAELRAAQPARARRRPRASMLMEGIALTGAWVDKEKGLLSLIALEMGVSSRLCAYLQPGEPVVVMGPTGTPTEIPSARAVLLAGGGLGNAVLFSIAKALKAQGQPGHLLRRLQERRRPLQARRHRGVHRPGDLGDRHRAPRSRRARPQDAHFRGNIVQAMVAYAEGELGPSAVPLERRHAHHRDRLRPHDERRAARRGTACCSRTSNPAHVGIGSINSPMQCMMKEVCAQCLQRHVDPATGKEEFIFSCYNQDQELDRVDFANLHARLRAEQRAGEALEPVARAPARRPRSRSWRTSSWRLADGG